MVLGFDALDTGIKMLPVSIAMLFCRRWRVLRLALKVATRLIVRRACCDPRLDRPTALDHPANLRVVGFATAMALLCRWASSPLSSARRVHRLSDASVRSEAGRGCRTRPAARLGVGVA